MYEKGDVKFLAPPCGSTDETGWCDERDHDFCHMLHDARDLNKGEKFGPLVYLPHSCDQWIIGGPDEMRLLIADLQEALREVEKV